jgi:hypothetical protein
VLSRGYLEEILFRVALEDTRINRIEKEFVEYREKTTT